jgi:hypothetical protein
MILTAPRSIADLRVGVNAETGTHQHDRDEQRERYIFMMRSFAVRQYLNAIASRVQKANLPPIRAEYYILVSA